MGHYLLKDSPKTGTGDLLISVQAVEPIKIPIPSAEIEAQIGCQLMEGKDIDENIIDQLVYKLYNLTEEEMQFIEGQ